MNIDAIINFINRQIKNHIDNKCYIKYNDYIIFTVLMMKPHYNLDDHYYPKIMKGIKDYLIHNGYCQTKISVNVYSDLEYDNILIKIVDMYEDDYYYNDETEIIDSFDNMCL